MKKRKVELKSPNFISIVHENSQRHSICLLLLSAIQSVIAPIVCYADEPHPAISDHAVMETGKINFDLSATRPTMPAAKVLGTSTGVTNIKVAGSVVSIAGASLVTPAQALSAYQVSKTGTQNLLVGASGNAVGGAFA
ncbi:MAG: hypothetical protein K2Z81_05515, partial [Cyanobacteria bacterium]|nr:hypothetical protein [Cyanobacteriota bacterium]